MSFLLAIATIGLMFSIDFRDTKAPYDEERKIFDWKEDWWKLRYDNLIPKFWAGVIGAVLSTELGVPVILWISTKQFGLDKEDVLENVAIHGMELSAVFLVTMAFIKYFGKSKK